MKPKQAVVGAL
jgi:hypothetical protein